MSTTRPSFTPTSKRRLFRPSTFQPLNPPSSLDSLNESLRSSLMSVGMRVRKSVPEGYKTTSKSQFSIYEQTAAAYPELQPFAGQSAHSVIPRRREADEKVGNMMTDAQLEDAVDNVLNDLDADLSGWDSLGSSQQSSASTSSITSVRFPSTPHIGKESRRKRSMGEEEAEGEEDSGCLAMDRDAPLRPIAQPRSRKTAMKRAGSDGSSKSVRFAAITADEDFGEAEFLMPDHDWER